MSVTLLYPFRRGHDRLFRGRQQGGVTVFYPFRIGTDWALRGKNCEGKIIYGWPFRRGHDLLARTTYKDCTPPTGVCCVPFPNEPTAGYCYPYTKTYCESIGGTWYETGEECQAHCPPQKRPCCLPGGACQKLSLENCENAGGRWIYYERECADVVCIPPEFRCCWPATIATSYVRVTISGMAGTAFISSLFSDFVTCNNKCLTATMDLASFNGIYYLKLDDIKFGTCKSIVAAGKSVSVRAPKVIGNAAYNAIIAAGCSRPDLGGAGPFRFSATTSVQDWSVDLDFTGSRPKVGIETFANALVNYSTVSDRTCTASDFPLQMVATEVVLDSNPNGCNGNYRYKVDNFNPGTATVEFAQEVPADWYLYLN